MKIVDRLQQMNNIHITVKESLQVGASKLSRQCEMSVYTQNTIPIACGHENYMKIETIKFLF